VKKLVAGAVVCVIAGVLVLLLGGEMLRWQRQMRRDDELFRATPGRADLWHVPGAPSWDPAKAVLGLDDDLRFREAVRLFKAARPGDINTYARPDLPARRAAAEVALQRELESAGDRSRRAQAANLLGVMQVNVDPSQDRIARANQLRLAITSFQQAVELDPENADAALNLELAWRTALENPLDPLLGGPGGFGDKGNASGAGEPGSGY